MQFRSSSTDKPLWEMDCREFLKDGLAFDLREVATVQHLEFCDAFSRFTGWSFEKKGNVVTFTPPVKEGSEKLLFRVKASGETILLRCRVYEQQKKWVELHAFALASFSLDDPEAELLAYAAWAEHKLQRTQEGWLFLQIYTERFGNNPEFAYRLACLCGALMQVNDARQWLRNALAHAEDVEKLMARALGQPELERLRPELEHAFRNSDYLAVRSK